MKSENSLECIVSVIVPMFNSEKYIARCIDSVLRQTFSGFELVLVDDGSTDDTKKICEGYKQEDSRISYYYQKNAGPDFARKKGIEEAKGDLLLFVDADDYIENNMLEIMYSNMKESSADLVCCQIKRQCSSSKIITDCDMMEEIIDCSTVKDSLHYYFAERFINSSYGTKLFNKELIREYHFLEDSVIGEDVSVVLFLLLQAKKVRILKNPLYIYSWNGKSISHSGYSQRHYISLKNYINVKEKLVSEKIISKQEICGFFSEYEMAAATAMSRNWVIDKKTVNLLRQDMKKNLRDIIKNTYTSKFMKICIVIYVFSPCLFMSIYHVIYRLTGR